MIFDQGQPGNIPEQQSNIFSLIPFAKIVGGILIVLALVTFGWVSLEIYQLYKHGESFLLMDRLIPKNILFLTFEESGKMYLPREIFVYGLPLWILGLAVQIGVALLKAGSQYGDKRNNQKNPER